MTDAVEAVLAFNPAINRRDLAARSELMTAIHRVIDSTGATADERALREGVARVLGQLPDYRNAFADVDSVGDGVVLPPGRSKRSFARLDGPTEWCAVVLDARVDVSQASEPTPRTHSTGGSGSGRSRLPGPPFGHRPDETVRFFVVG